MSLKALFYAYVLGGITFIPLLLFGAIFYAAYTSLPVDAADARKSAAAATAEASEPHPEADEDSAPADPPRPPLDVNDLPRVRKGWLTVRRTFREAASDATYVGLVRGFLDARSKERARPKDTWYVVLKGKVLYLYEDEAMSECEAAIELGGHDVRIFPEGLLDGELFAKRNAICLRPKADLAQEPMPSVTKEMRLAEEDIEERVDELGGGPKQRQRERERLAELEKQREEAREEALDISTPWFIFVRSVVEMEDWYHALVHASDHAANSPTLEPLEPVFQPADMLHLVETLDEQPDVIPMRWLNALLGRLFFSYYRTETLESYIIGRLMKKISKIKKPGFLTDIVVREVSVGNKAPTLSKPMLKELTKEGDASLELHLHYKGEFRITVETVATIALGTFRTYTVKLVLALVIREIEGNMLVKVKRPPSSRIWYAFTQMPRVVLDVEPVVSDRQITWSMILSTIESKVKEVIQESVVMPNMDDISFFHSSKYQHRGGIWADASRREAPSSFPTPTPPPEDARSTSSAPPPEIPKVASETELPPVQRSRSVEEPETQVNGSAGPPEGVPLRPSVTGVSSSPPSSNARRRTWFGTPPDGFSVSDASGVVESGISRGRPPDMDSTTTRRSSSTPSSGEGSQDVTPQAVAAAHEASDFLSADQTRRSSSQQSRSSSSRSASVRADDSDDESAGGGPESNTLMYRSKSPSQNSLGRSTPTSPSFLQTLKSRAGDKQALSNSAKEAMRKWGVNWGALRKESGGSNAGIRAASPPPPPEDHPDGGHADQQQDSRMHRVRPSYAEVRAAVEQRRAGDRPAHGAPFLGADLPQSDAIPIPESPKGKERARSPSPSSRPGGTSSYSGGATLSPSTSPRPAENAGASSQPRAVSPTLALQRTESQKSNPDGSDESDQPRRPLHTKPPQAISMTIPGIHASHRGEVMSMGYAPPPPPPPASEAKKPAIQSVYRLWKAPNSSVSTSPPRGAGSPPQVETAFAGPDPDAAAPLPPPDAQPAPAQDPPQPARATPPALPPRKNLVRAALAQAEAGRRAEGAPADPASAAAALQSIVSKDRGKRASLEPGQGQGGHEAAGASGDARAADAGSALPRPGPRPPALPPRRPPAAQA